MNKLYMGIDIGSISTKGVIIDEYNNIITSSYLYTEGNPIRAVKNVIKNTRNEIDFRRGTFRAKGDVLEIYPSDQSETAVRVSFWGDEIEKISEINPLTGKAIATRQHIMIFPNSHYVTSKEKMEKAIVTIEKEMEEVKYH